MVVVVFLVCVGFCCGFFCLLCGFFCLTRTPPACDYFSLLFAVHLAIGSLWRCMFLPLPISGWAKLRLRVCKVMCSVADIKLHCLGSQLFILSRTVCLLCLCLSTRNNFPGLFNCISVPASSFPCVGWKRIKIDAWCEMHPFTLQCFSSQHHLKSPRTDCYFKREASSKCEHLCCMNMILDAWTQTALL